MGSFDSNGVGNMASTMNGIENASLNVSISASFDWLLDGLTVVQTLALVIPRIVAMFSVLPLFDSKVLPGLLRNAMAIALSWVLIPGVFAQVKAQHFTHGELLVLVVKEGFVGFVLGYLMALPFWAMEAMGFFVDNQRGAGITASLNPLTGNDSSPLGGLFHQAFIVYFLISGGMAVVLGVLYDSYVLWDIIAWTPALRAASMPWFIAQMGHMVELALLLSAPIIIVMMLAEAGLALVGRFIPQLQVFFIAMPIKSALAMLVLMVYGATLLDFAGLEVARLPELFKALQVHWGGVQSVRPVGAP
jgi:type III secretion protein T